MFGKLDPISKFLIVLATIVTLLVVFSSLAQTTNELLNCDLRGGHIRWTLPVPTCDKDSK